jgi:peptidoglycan/LPS O-acetylase OafA/YrhL
MRYNPTLDGIRALAVLAVIAFHAHVPGFRGGYVGVDVFFVLSGYLITRVLEEAPDLRAFYWRRLKRLAPPLALMLAAYLLVFPALRPGYPHARDAAVAFFYLSDYTLAFAGIPDILRHTWSLAVEEHFYLLWPLVFLRWRPSVRWLLLAYVAATLWRASWNGWDQAYHRFDTHATGLILGCAIASARRVDFPAWPGLVLLAICCVAFSWRMPAVQTIGFTVAEIGAVILVLGRPPTWLGHPALAYVGRLSYGMYLWHYPLARIVRDDGASWQVVLAVSLIGSVPLAALSYHTIEAWIRRRGVAKVAEVQPV